MARPSAAARSVGDSGGDVRVVISRLTLVGPDLYSGAESVVDKFGHAIPALVVGDATYLRTVRRIGAAVDSTCSYLDGSGARCERTCDGQVSRVDGQPYCVRHAAIAEAIAFRRGTVFEICPPPQVDDRGFNLLLTLVKETSPRVLALLHSRFHERNVAIAADSQPRRIRSGSVPEWEQGWWATAGRPVSRVAIRVSAGYTPEVSVLVDHVRRFSAAPDWTATRSPAARHALWHRVVNAVRRGMDEGEGRPAWAS